MYRARNVLRAGTRLASATRQAARNSSAPPLITRRVDFIAPRSHLPKSFHGVSVLRNHAFENRAPALPECSSSSFQCLSVISSAKSENVMPKMPQTLYSPIPPRKTSRRILLSGRLRAGIEKRKTLRAYSTPSNAKRAEMTQAASAVKAAASSEAAVPSQSVPSTPATAASEKPSKATTSSTPSRISWRDATKSPMKAVRYVGQLRRDLVDWMKHIWAGAKLLAADVRVSAAILRRITNGKQISRRERNFIVQTGVDLARLVPFSLFLIIPAAEFALPFALRLFPHMLPSQFQDQMKKEEDMKRSLKGRLELAKYLRDVVEEKAKTIKASSADSELKQDAESLTRFLEAIRSGAVVDPGEVSKFARLFKDEITMDGAVRPQLVAMCKYMGLSPYGHDQFLRFKLHSRLNTIKRDDMQIMWEGGADSLTDEEVVKACRDRGIRTVGTSKERLRRQLNDWLDLSQKKEIPGSLMIMSRAFLYTGSEGLKETLGSLPEDVIMDVKKAADIGEASNQERLDEARRQAKLIAIESEVEKRKEKDEEERRKKKEEELSASMEEQVDVETSISDTEVMARTEAHEAKIAEEVFGVQPVPDATVPVQEASSGLPHVSGVISDVKDEEELQKEQDDIRQLLVSLGELSSESAVEKEREELKSLKEELAEAMAIVKETGKSEGSDLKRFKSLVTKLEREVEKVDAVVGLRMKLLDKDNDGLMSFEECKSIMNVIAGKRDDAMVSETLRRLDADADGNISKADLSRLLKELQGESSVLDTPPPTPAQ